MEKKQHVEVTLRAMEPEDLDMLYHIMTYNQVEPKSKFLHLKYIGGNETPSCSVLLEKCSCIIYPSL